MNEQPSAAVAWRDALRERDARIKARREEGATLRAIAAEVGMSHVGVHAVLHRSQP